MDTDCEMNENQIIIKEANEITELNFYTATPLFLHKINKGIWFISYIFGMISYETFRWNY